MAMSAPDTKYTSSSSLSSSNQQSPSSSPNSFDKTSSMKNITSGTTTKTRKRKKYRRKRGKTPTEKQRDNLRRSRQAKYEMIRKNAGEGKSPPLWDFESLFPEPMWDDNTIYRDLFEINDKEKKQELVKEDTDSQEVNTDQLSNANKIVATGSDKLGSSTKETADKIRKIIYSSREMNPDLPNSSAESIDENAKVTGNNTKVDRVMTRMVEDRMYGFRRSTSSDFQYDTSLMGDGAVKFRDGVRLGRALRVNVDKLTYHGKRELNRNRLEEAEELFEKAIEIDSRDGRAYLGLSRIAQRRRDFKYARECLCAGLANSISLPLISPDGFENYDNGANPFLLQAAGCLEERMGHLSEAENLFVEATKSRQSHAAAWVSLAQLRTRKLRQGAHAGRECYQTAEKELEKAGLPPSSYVYSAWGSLECNAGDIRKARKLFVKALDVDPKCSAAWLQLGVMESNNEDWDKAQECFETVLTFDRRNSKVLQAYAIMESKRPDGDSRQVIDLFERALAMNSRDAGVLQAYALYVAKLGDIDGARALLKRGIQVDRKHAPVWQAWGVLETQFGSAEVARDIFQQGIWASAQSSGGQSGGRRCARLWQAWGVLEAQEGDHAAARRCFSRALDADSRNVAAITAWTIMEEELGNYKDAKLIFERALKQFASPSDEKMNLWRAYEMMEGKAGNIDAAQTIYQRSIRDSIMRDELNMGNSKKTRMDTSVSPTSEKNTKNNNEVEVSRWASENTSGFAGRDIWMNDGSIESKVPLAKKKARKSK
eukprot:CAMPEP_0197825684 /NCGR_PEP_ID=MMETSP1437-20131217/2728_1 /TAXON_ID=49252 ORGANISM="Eucampia antarctica, Strain CCMP1452" /NCGR_SAMPLE_ID=MMETSP1437 /ASSEMBLY_ACC=CAM_ASM_001096 /LENGTH=769 /DNA_ID=CAMNT_0043425795 /DNA_START=137 /DNA_END=2446 /DNA_ORIENTATION=-